MEKMKELILDGTRIEALPDSVGRLKNLCLLSLEDCKSLKALPDSIRELSSLQQIKMSGTNLRGSDSGSSHLAASAEVSFSSSGQLLGLSGTNLRGSESSTSHLAASAEVSFSSSGQLLGLSGTNLRGSESSTSHLAVLAEVTVSTSKLLDLSDESRKALKHLHLADTKTEELPNCIKRMRNLEELLLECEMLRVLPNWIERFSEKLTKLEVSSKDLEALPDCIGSLKQLKKFSLKCENLQALPDSIGGLEILDHLKIESANLKALPNSIASLGRLQYLLLRCTSLEALPDHVGELKELEHFEVWSDSLIALPDSIGSLRKVSILKLKCPNLEVLPDSIGDLESLLFFEVRSHGLTYLPNSIGSLKRIQYLLLNCMNLEALPGSMETLESLKDLKLHCNNLMVPPDFIGRLENLSLDLSYCKSLKYIPQLPSSLLWLDAANCTNLRKTSDVSHLKALENLNLKGCKLLEDVPGLEHITNGLEVLGVPGPCDLLGFCHLSDDFKRRVLKNKEVTFESLREFEMSGSVVRGSSTGPQQLHFMLPRLPFSWLRGAQLRLGLDKVVSPVHVAIMADDTIVFQKIVEVEGTTIELNLGEESFMNTGEGKGEHCFTMQVTADVTELQDVMAILQYLSDFRFLSQILY
ncbi:Plant intracellular Ras-group-related LRR protein 1 [Nymphaea thermarum]|nr:Plant intracellular Ras-group-related LRR protein 1 [Nymphaea thermarum]